MTNPPPPNTPSRADESHLNVIHLGRTRYADCWKYQKQLVGDRAINKIVDTLLITEHDPVITMGRGTDKANLLASPEELSKRKIDLFEIERGGDITFHGPGQLVAYPLISLSQRDKDTHKYLRNLENTVIDVLNKMGLAGSIKPGLTGVWIGDAKVCAIGVGVSKWITFHGLALNINTDLEYFRLMNPCGITKYPVSSLNEVTGRPVDMETAAGFLIEAFARIFVYDKVTTTRNQITFGD